MAAVTRAPASIAPDDGNSGAGPSSTPLPTLFSHTSQYETYLLTETELEQQWVSSTSAESSPLPRDSAILLIQYYLYRIPLLGKAFGFNERVISTAMSYFKRYWLANKTCHVGIPIPGPQGREFRGGKGVKLVMLICLYLSTKTHSSPISLQAFATRISTPGNTSDKSVAEAAIKETEDGIRNNEFSVASVLGWKFRVTHAFEGVRGLSIDLQTIKDPSIRPLSSTLLDQCAAQLNLLCSHLRLTNAEFLYTPSQLALGIWSYLVDNPPKDISQEDQQNLQASLSLWVDSKLPTGKEQVTSKVHQITSVHIPNGQRLEVDMKSNKDVLTKIKEIDLQLKNWVNDYAEREVNGNGSAEQQQQQQDDDDDED
ncbi:unnamed protein product [Sympodiomycopsis kandeliae]